jgi:hypothetical protein
MKTPIKNEDDNNSSMQARIVSLCVLAHFAGMTILVPRKWGFYG